MIAGIDFGADIEAIQTGRFITIRLDWGQTRDVRGVGITFFNKLSGERMAKKKRISRYPKRKGYVEGKNRYLIKPARGVDLEALERYKQKWLEGGEGRRCNAAPHTSKGE